jgi:hypothetical protein
MSLMGKLKAARAELEMPEDPWLAPLHRVCGKVEFDGQERVSSQSLLDLLGTNSGLRSRPTPRPITITPGCLPSVLARCNGGTVSVAPWARLSAPDQSA